MIDARLLCTHARELLGRDEPHFAGLLQRSTAFLTRQALESAVATTLASGAPGTERVSARAQLLCLTSVGAAEIAYEATYLWMVLSRACHHHHYELAPTWDEIDTWLTQTEAVIARLPSSSTPPAAETRD